MSSQNTEDQKIHGGHLLIIASCALCLMFLTVMKNGFHIFPETSANDEPTLTYEEAKKQVLADMGPMPEAGAEQGAAQNQIAMLDPSLNQGSVLGTSTGVSDLFPSIDTVLTSDSLAKIKINLLKDSNADLVKTYADQVSAAESGEDILNLLSGLSSDDPKVLGDTYTKTKSLVTILARIPVPLELADYHRLKMVYLTTVGDLATNLSGKTGLADMESATTLFFSLNDKLGRMKADIFNKYNINLQ